MQLDHQYMKDFDDSIYSAGKLSHSWRLRGLIALHQVLLVQHDLPLHRARLPVNILG